MDRPARQRAGAAFRATRGDPQDWTSDDFEVYPDVTAAEWSEATPSVGQLQRGMRVYDAVRDREGLVNGIGEPYAVDEQPSCVWLVPPGGGYEWRADIVEVRVPKSEASQ
ncbi:hypothetical protein [Streptomyces boncukensis]|uniref:Uncharacterized protein n=1 Tax=Streptomyces boncukensis TaxID=2711219 RepID=A0A6G4WQT9_9ACTN|nr:hypothetical protein [Streptomyces boncukensis]NGO67639.1 hypothetical protein [Streptomyces boncukensis]